MRRHRLLLGASILAALAWQGVVLLVPLVLGWTIEAGIEGESRRVVWVGGGAVLLLGAAEAFFDAARHQAENSGSARVAASLRDDVVAAALALDDEQRVAFPPGEVIARATSDVDGVSALFNSVGYTSAYAMMVPTVLLIVAWFDPWLAAALLGTTLVSMVLFWRTSDVWERRSIAVQEAVGAMTMRVQETAGGFKTIRGLRAEDADLARFEGTSTEVRSRALHLARLWIPYAPMLDVLSALPVVLVLWRAGVNVTQGSMAIGEAVAVIGLAVFVVGPIRALAEHVLSVQMALASADRLGALIDLGAPERLEGGSAGREASEAGASLTLSGTACFVPGREQPLFAPVDLRLAPGDVLLVDGTVGSGKTSLLMALAGGRSYAGSIALGDGPPAGRPPEDLRDELLSRVLLVEQRPFIFDGTVEDNVRIGDPDADPARIEDALLAADVTEFAGLDYPVGERGLQLSGGQRQRLALARALLARPDVLLLDGATNELEPMREVAVLRNVVARWRHGIVVIVTPNPLVADLATATLRLQPSSVETTSEARI